MRNFRVKERGGYDPYVVVNRSGKVGLDGTSGEVHALFKATILLR